MWWYKSGVFQCGQVGHFAKNCLVRKQQETPQPTIESKKPKTQRSFALTQEDAKASNTVVTGVLPISS